MTQDPIFTWKGEGLLSKKRTGVERGRRGVKMAHGIIRIHLRIVNWPFVMQFQREKEDISGEGGHNTVEYCDWRSK